MPRVRATEALKLINKRGKNLGSVEHVLFHPDEPRVIGFQLMQPRLWYVIDRRPLFVPLSEVKVGTERLDALNDKVVSGRKAARAAGFGWAETVMWIRMPVRTRSGKAVGFVHDVEFAEDGAATNLVLSEGLTSDMAIGRRTVEGKYVKGFREDAVVVEDVVAESAFSGGAAGVTARAVVTAKQNATEAAVKTVAFGKATAQVAAKSKAGKKAMGLFRGLVDEVKDAMADPDEDT